MELTVLAADSIESETKYWVFAFTRKLNQRYLAVAIGHDDESESIMMLLRKLCQIMVKK